LTVLGQELDEKYEVLQKFRVGGMGAIYKVRHRLLDEVRVIKTVRRPGASDETAVRFLLEAKAATRLRHPNVANLYDFALGSEGNAYIIMEYIEGLNLQEVLRGYGPPPLALTIEIAHQALRALAYLHRLKIIHRDISPDNLMLTRDVDGAPLVKVIDLGIAKSLEEEPEKRTGGGTGTGVFVGKPRYGSPERFDGGSSDARSDLYSFGVVLYELLTGLCPIAGTETAAFMAGHLFLPPRDFAETDPSGRVPDDLRALVLRALAKAPEDRMASAEDFLWELTMIQDRYPLLPDTAEELWQLLRPSHNAALPPESRSSFPPGLLSSSLKTPLAIPLSMVRAWAARAPAAGEAEDITQKLRSPPHVTGESVQDTPLAPLSVPPAAKRRDGDTWASRPLRAVLVDDVAAPPPLEPPPAEAVPSFGKRSAWDGWLVAAGAVAGLLLLGLWLVVLPLRGGPEPAPTVEIPAPSPSAPVASVSPPEPARLPQGLSGAGPAGSPPPSITPGFAAERRQPSRPMKVGDMILRDDPGVQEPEIQIFPAYSYPAAAKGSGRKATVRIAVLVDERGQVIESRIQDGDRSGLGFEQTALDAAKRARFLPPLRDHLPGKMWAELLFSFSE
jgi:TonB family protein